MSLLRGEHQSRSRLVPALPTTDRAGNDLLGRQHGNTIESSYDGSKWDTLVKYDEDIALVAAELRPLGRHWVDEFAKAYLSLNDKAYVPNIVQKIIADAKAAELHGPEAEPASRPMMRETFDRWFFAARDRSLSAARPAPASKDGDPPPAAFPKWVVPIIVGLAIGACVVLLATSGGVPPR